MLHRVKNLGRNVRQTTCHRLLLRLLANHFTSLLHPPGCKCVFLLSVISVQAVTSSEQREIICTLPETLRSFLILLNDFKGYLYPNLFPSN